MNSSFDSQRLTLRPFTSDEVDDMAAMNADRRVMEFFPKAMKHEESAAFVNRIMRHQKRHGFSLYALRLKDDESFCGFAGLLTAEFKAAFAPAVEIGRRLPYAFWGQGLAPEAARACLKHAFQKLQLDEIVSFTAMQNLRSMRVMEKIGMHRDLQGDSDHPNLAPGHWLARHVLYRLGRKEWNVCPY